jgi:hypothetical protein
MKVKESKKITREVELKWSGRGMELKWSGRCRERVASTYLMKRENMSLRRMDWRFCV